MSREALSSSVNFAFARFYLYPHRREKKGQNTIQLFLHGSQRKASRTLVLKTDFLSLNHKKSRLLTFLCTWRKINHFIHGSDAVFFFAGESRSGDKGDQGVYLSFVSLFWQEKNGHAVIDSKTLMSQIKQVTPLGALLRVWEENRTSRA